ncbi:MAG: hypothetical protein IKZ93_09065 [Prevotella sp.]|nr:hypothetical protein [Prevotella sp.]
MKQQSICSVIISRLTAILASLQKLPAGIRKKINEIEDESNKYSNYTYKDTESNESFGFFIGLNREMNMPPTIHR